MRDYYKNSKDFKGIPYDINTPKRDYYVPKKEEKTEIRTATKKERKTSKDYETLAKLGGEKFMREYTLYPLFKRRAIILSFNNKKLLENLLDYEKNEKLQALIKDKLERL